MGAEITIRVPPAFAAFALSEQLSIWQEVCSFDQISELPPDLTRKVQAPHVKAHVCAPLG